MKEDAYERLKWSGIYKSIISCDCDDEDDLLLDERGAGEEENISEGENFL